MKNTEKSRFKRLFRLPWVFTFLIILAIVLIVVFAGLRKTEVPVAAKRKLANVEVQTVKAQPFTESLTLPALIAADRVASIKPEFSGTLARWLYPEGSEVEIGDVVAEIDTKSMRLNLEEMEAALKTASQNVVLRNIMKEKAEVNLTNMRRNVTFEEVALESAESNLALVKSQYNRIQQMAEKNIATQAQLEDAENSLKQAEFAVAQAKQRLDSAMLNIQSAELAVKEAEAGIQVAEARSVELEASIERLDYQIKKGQLKAPFSGKLEEHLVEAGEIVSPNAPVVNIYDLKFLRATVDVPDRYIAFIDPKNKEIKSYIDQYLPGAEQRISVKIIIPGLPKLSGGTESDVELDASVARIAQSANPESNTFQVELRFPNPGNALRHGQIARGKIAYLYYQDAILIPVKAIQVTDAGPRVLVVENKNGDEIAALRDITPVSIQGSIAFIRGGLEAGERLILAGWKGLVGGEKVNILVDDGVFQKPE